MTLKMLKLINVITKLVIIIVNYVCQRDTEKDEKLEQLRLAFGRQRLATQNLGGGYGPSSARRMRAVKKRHLHPLCGHLLPLPCSVWPDAPETDTRTIDQAVGVEAEPNI